VADTQTTPSPSKSLDCIATFEGHTSWVYGVPITPDSKILASVSFNKILVWDLDAKSLIHVLEGHEDMIFSLSINSDGQTLARGSIDKTVKLWSLKTGELLNTLAVRKDPIHAVAFSPNGKVLASGGAAKYKSDEGKNTTIYLWNSGTADLIHTLSGHTKRINQLAFSPDGQLLVSESNDGTVNLWNPNTGELLRTLDIAASCIAITPDSKNLVSGGEGGIKVWNLEDGKLERTLCDGTEFIKCFAISPDGKLLASGAHTKVETYDFNTGELLSTADFPFAVSMYFSSDGKLLASGDATCFSGGGLVKVWRSPSMQVEDIKIEDLKIVPDARKKLESEGFFDPQNVQDARERILSSIVRRQGQSEFRKQLLEAYNYQCCITGCNVEAALEAAHIVPYSGIQTNHVQNGLLLRSDIHTLFDLYYLTVHPDTQEIVISQDLVGSCYAQLAGNRIREPKDQDSKPSQEAIRQHYQLALVKRAFG
jgi:WD40 repeat protein